MSHRPLQYSLSTLFGWVTFAAVMCWMCTLSTLTCILAVIIAKHVLVAWLCKWYMGPRPAGAPALAAGARTQPAEQLVHGAGITGEHVSGSEHLTPAQDFAGAVAAVDAHLPPARLDEPAQRDAVLHAPA